MSIVTLFTVVKDWKQPRSSSTENGLKSGLHLINKMEQITGATA